MVLLVLVLKHGARGVKGWGVVVQRKTLTICLVDGGQGRESAKKNERVRGGRNFYKRKERGGEK